MRSPEAFDWRLGLLSLAPVVENAIQGLQRLAPQLLPEPALLPQLAQQPFQILLQARDAVCIFLLAPRQVPEQQRVIEHPGVVHQREQHKTAAMAAMPFASFFSRSQSMPCQTMHSSIRS